MTSVNFLIKKSSFSFFLLAMALLLMMFKSQRLYFTWTVPVTLISLFGVLASMIYIYNNQRIYSRISYSAFFFSILLILLYVYDFFIIARINLWSFIVTCCTIWVSIFLLMTDVSTKQRLLVSITKITQIIVAISLVGWLLFLLGIPLPHYYTDSDSFYTHTVYYLFLLNGTPEEQLIPRFAGMFLEPGHLGTICCFLLHVDNYNIRKKGNCILLLGILFSLSLAAYGLLIGGVCLYLLFNKRKGIFYVGSFVFVIVAVWLFSVEYNGGENALNEKIFTRLMFEDGEMVGSNRTSTVFDYQYKRYMASEDVLFGTGKAAFGVNEDDNITLGCAGWKRYFFLRGYVGSFLLIAFLLSYLWRYYSFRSLSFFIVYVVANMIRDYPLKEYWMFIFILVLPVLYYSEKK